MKIYKNICKKSFINKFIWEKTFSIRKKWLEKNEKNNVTIAVNVLHTTNKKIYPPYVSKNNSNQEKKVIFNDSKWKGVTLSYSKKLLALLRGITSKHYS